MLYFRHSPRVPLRLLRDSQLMLLQLLNAEPGTMDDLRQRTSLPLGHLEHDLTCLYYAGSITTTRSKAAATAPLQGAEGYATYRAELTTPGMLEPAEPGHEGSTIRESSKRV